MGKKRYLKKIKIFFAGLPALLLIVLFQNCQPKFHQAEPALESSSADSAAANNLEADLNLQIVYSFTNQTGESGEKTCVAGNLCEIPFLTGTIPSYVRSVSDGAGPYNCQFDILDFGSGGSCQANYSGSFGGAGGPVGDIKYTVTDSNGLVAEIIVRFIRVN